MVLSKVYQVAYINENPSANWVKNLDLIVNDEIEIKIYIDTWSATGHTMSIKNLRNNKAISINSKSFSNDYGKIIIKEE